MSFLIAHTTARFDLLALITLALLIAAVAVLVIRCRKMSKVKDDLRDEIDKAEKSSPDGI
jgi:hypothetical protein